MDPAIGFLLAVVVILAGGRVLGALVERCFLPMVIGEIAIGLALGPSLLGSIAPGISDQIFSDEVMTMIKGLSQLGLIVFAFEIGRDLSAMKMGGSARRITMVSLGSIIVPFIGGVAIAIPLATHYLGESGQVVTFAMFVGIAMSVTAVPVLARILQDFDISNTRAGQVSLASAAAGDALSWLLLSVCLALNGGASSTRDVVMNILGIIIVIVVLAVRPVRTRIENILTALDGGTGRRTVVIAVAGFACIMVVLGLHQIIGAIIVGVLWPTKAREHVENLLETSKHILLPFVFFGFGFQVDLTSAFASASAVGVFFAILAVAAVTKIFAAAAAAQMSGMGRPESFVVGVLMNARGLTELVVLEIGYVAGIISQDLHGILTVVALVTTAMTGGILRLAGIHRWAGPQVSTPREVVPVVQ